MKSPPAAEIAFAPPLAEPRRLQRAHAAIERGRAERAPGDRSRARGLAGRELERAAREVAVAAQVNRVALRIHDLHAEHVAEIPEAAVRFGRVDLDAAEGCDVANRLRGCGHECRPCG